MLIILAFPATLSALSACALMQAIGTHSALPPDTGKREITSNLYQNPQPVEIDGYDSDCMEPFITGNGKYLLFNNSNAANVETHIHINKRVAENRFQHLGLLPGSVSQSKDMAPSIDADGNLFFTSLRSFDKDGNSIYCGRFVNETMIDAGLPKGEISPRQPAVINMDCDISKDGKTLILSRAHFPNPFLPPDKSDLMQAVKSADLFSIDQNSESVLANINTSALEYAPCLSADQLELFFTRASNLMIAGDPKAQGANFRIMVAKRKTRREPFGVPERLQSLVGFVEAPTITYDKKDLYFHKKVGDKFRIFHAQRNAKAL